MQYVYDLAFIIGKGDIYHTYTMFMISILFIRKRETVSYLQYVYVLDYVYQKDGTVSYYVYDLDFVYKKEGNCIIPTVCLCSIFFYIRKRENVSYLQNV